MKATSLLLAAAAMASTALANIQVNYYSDNGCHNYAGDVQVTWATNAWSGPDNCYNYQYGKSANIANCSQGNCFCNFYSNQGCSGSVYTSNWSGSGSNCLTAISNQKSFACYYN